MWDSEATRGTGVSCRRACGSTTERVEPGKESKLHHAACCYGQASSKQVQTRSKRELQPMFAPAHSSSLPHCRRRATFAPVHCSSLPTRCRKPNMAKNLAPNCARRPNMGSPASPVPKNSRNCMAPSAITSLLRCPTRCTVSVCARARYVKNVLRLHFWGVDRPAFAIDKTVKDLLQGCRQCCSLANYFLLENLCRLDLLAPPRHLWQGHT